MSGSEKLIPYRKAVYRHIKDSIIAHALRPGDMINERRLAEQLGVSRTPVREAIQSLRDEGWLAVMPRKGAVVRELKRVDMEEMLQLRYIIALSSLDFGGHKAGPADIAYFESLLARQKEAMVREDVLAFMAADMALHVGIVRLAGNRRLLEFSQDLCDNFQRLGIHVLIRTRRFMDCIHEHELVVRALAAGDVRSAKKAMAGHLARTREAVLGTRVEALPVFENV